jgi:hypothetical protein
MPREEVDRRGVTHTYKYVSGMLPGRCLHLGHDARLRV